MAALTRIFGFGVGTEATSQFVESLFGEWGSTQVAAKAPYPSNIGDDHSPFEYSLAFSPSRTEVRLLFETQAVPPSRVANQQAATAFNERLAERPGVDMKRFERVSSLFMGAHASSDFSLWHAASIDQAQGTSFKLYLNPQANGEAEATRLVADAVARLGLPPHVMTTIGAVMRRPELDRLSYFSLDLSDHAQSRVKIYVAHDGITPAELDDVFSICPSHRRGDVIDFCQSVAGSTSAFQRKPLMSCLSFVGGAEEPSAMTLHLPVAHYVENDELVLRAICNMLKRHGYEHERYTQAVGAIARRPLERASGIQSYFSYRREKQGLRFTAYLSPELFSHHP